MKYVVVEFADVFRDEFLEFINQGGGIKKIHLSLVMKEVEKFEQRKGVEFVAFFGNEFVIFKTNEM